MSTALHFAVFLENMRLTETLLDIKASLEIPCSNLLQQLLGSEEVLLRVSYFRSIFCRNLRFGSAFPIFLAFLQSNPDMCKLLVEHGAGREAMIVYLHGDPKAMSILHFAAADQTTDYRQWQCLFDGFREYIDEPCPRESQSTPLHVALITGCTQGMQIAVETGADKESRDGASRTPLSSGIMEFSHCTVAEPTPFEERMMCLRKFVNLGGIVNPDGASLLGFAVQRYVLFPTYRPDLRHVIHFLLEHHVDINRTFERNTNMVNEIIVGTIHRADHLPSLESLRELLRDSIDRGLNLTSPAPGLPSPLYRVLNDRKAEPDWLFDLLCENGATIHEHEVNYAFRRWCGIPRLWETNNYNAWWQHKGQEDEIFQKWCEHPYNAWWWQHVNHISPQTVELAYAEAFRYGGRKLYDLLTHLPLPGSTVGRPLCQDLFAAMELEPSFGRRGYSAAEATWDILHLRDKGVDMTFRNRKGKTPLDILLGSGSSRDGFMEVVAVLEGEAPKVQELA
ncbi:uncharacterized protein CPUR_05663 [Claviceps purpurea 20.1]|uniref:Uncharacterized protein n=1 Tax=Claviceps purpurea (strain 20.1) TaxID=1111077 RepID=M1WCT2_CLAP2|nr:uncharacterized protein CPUR_05663 [Claviceps purpurea 20.1]